jgi:ASC-1-like (ASCH) protein
MDHLAIMRKSWNLTQKILTGEKKIESRWYYNKYPPWNRIKAGDTVYFKDSGEPVTIVSKVEKVIQFSNLNREKVKKILDKYGKKDGIGIEDKEKYFDMFKDKKYCILVFLKNPKRIKPFKINKDGFGIMSAWITVNKISDIIL